MTKYFTKEQVMTAMGEQNLMLDDIWGVEQRLDELSAADVVEVVRCKDCRYFTPQAGWGGGQCSYLEDKFEFSEVLMFDDDYCSDGERMDGGENDA